MLSKKTVKFMRLTLQVATFLCVIVSALRLLGVLDLYATVYYEVLGVMIIVGLLWIVDKRMKDYLNKYTKE